VIAQPLFATLNWVHGKIGNWGWSIILVTALIKLIFYPLSQASGRSMAKMRAVGPRMKQIQETYKDDRAKLGQAMMDLYKKEKINPLAGCWPMALQIPVFFSLYKVIYITIEMRQAPFFGWIHDLSAEDPTNLFNAFGMIPFDPTAVSPLLHVGLLPLIMGLTMFLQQRLNPAPADPAQARMFQFMPLMFTFMLARSPAGLVLYWAWNNLLSVGQQWLIMRQATAKTKTKTTTPAKA
jgi:YidC/Oxa1 family membrane protein insertase